VVNPKVAVVSGIPVRKVLEGINSLTITKQSLGATEADLLTRALTDMKSPDSLTAIDLSSNNLTYRAIDALLPGISQLKKLKKLDLSHNLLCREGAETLAGFLATTNRRLTSLRIQECDICNGGNSISGIEALVGAVAHNKYLTELDVTGNQVANKYLVRIKDSLSVNRSLLYESHTELDRMILAQLPPMPYYDNTPEKGYRVPDFDERWLRKERYAFREFIIEPEPEVVVVEVVSAKKNKKKGGRDAKEGMIQKAKETANMLLHEGMGLISGEKKRNSTTSSSKEANSRNNSLSSATGGEARGSIAGITSGGGGTSRNSTRVRSAGTKK